MKKLLALLLLITNLTQAQKNFLLEKPLEDKEQEIFDVVLTLFDGMRSGDSSKVSSAFSSKASMSTSFKDTNGKVQLKAGDLQKFLNAVGTPHEQIWDEPIWNTKIHINQNLAMVWTDYAFYAGKTFSHCGVDAFLLHKEQRGWKIFHLTDTRQKEGCNVPVALKEGRTN